MSTKVAVGNSVGEDAYKCGIQATQTAYNKLDGKTPKLALVFAAVNYDYPQLLKGIREVIPTVDLIGCSTAGEFTGDVVSDKAVVLMLIASDEMRFSVAMGKGLKENSVRAVSQIFSEFRQQRGNILKEYQHRNIMLLSDGLAGNGEEMVDNFALESGMKCAIIGGAAADGGRFQQTSLFFRGNVYTNAVVAVEILSNKPIGIGVNHGWKPSAFSKMVTKAEGNVIYELDGVPAIKIYEEYTQHIGYKLTADNTNMFMMANELGVEMPNNEIKVRAPLSTNADGAITCATGIPVGKKVSIVESQKQNLIAAAKTATNNAMQSLNGNKPAGVIVFNCIARKILLKENFQQEIAVIKETAAGAPLIGFNTYGEIARVAGQLSGFHNTTDVVCTLPE